MPNEIAKRGPKPGAIQNARLVLSQSMVGKRYGSMVVLSFAGIKDGFHMIAVECDCGTTKTLAAANVRNGHTRSCGCKQHAGTHGLTNHPLAGHAIWCAMIQRCANPNNQRFDSYGGRGIAVCKRWLSFAAFHKDMGFRPSREYSLERKKNNRGYSKGNCKWAIRDEQANNTRGNRLITFRGETLTVAQWERKLQTKTIRGRLSLGWTVEKALTTPKVITGRAVANG